jgi:C1A family cysteine protease
MYTTVDEHNTRFGHFCKAIQRIEANKLQYGAEYTLSKFSDMSEEEFKRSRTGLASFPANVRFHFVVMLHSYSYPIFCIPSVQADRNSVGKEIVASCLANGVTQSKLNIKGSVPASFDWTTEGKVSPVKDQGASSVYISPLPGISSHAIPFPFFIVF